MEVERLKGKKTKITPRVLQPCIKEEKYSTLQLWDEENTLTGLFPQFSSAKNAIGTVIPVGHTERADLPADTSLNHGVRDYEKAKEDTNYK